MFFYHCATGLVSKKVAQWTIKKNCLGLNIFIIKKSCIPHNFLVPRIIESAPKTFMAIQTPDLQSGGPSLKNCHFLTPACNLNLFLVKWFHLKCYESALYWFYPKYVSGSVHVLIWEDIEDKLDYLKDILLGLKKSFCLRFLWIPSNVGRQNQKEPFF